MSLRMICCEGPAYHVRNARSICRIVQTVRVPPSKMRITTRITQQKYISHERITANNQVRVGDVSDESNVPHAVAKYILFHVVFSAGFGQNDATIDQGTGRGAYRRFHRRTQDTRATGSVCP